MKKFIIIISMFLMLLVGCEDSRMPSGFNDMPRPVVVVTCNRGGLVLRDAKANIHSYHTGYYFVEPFLNANLPEGYVLLPVLQENEE